MSSVSHSTNTAKIALFQAGLSQNESFFVDTINMLVNSSNKMKKFVGSGNIPSYIDMSRYNPSDNQFHNSGAGPNLIDQNQKFLDTIEAIVNMAVTNPLKVILVRTNLTRKYDDYYNQADSILNQKSKLLKIISEISKTSNIDIFLVGHSQGGLVNLEAATECPNSIKKLISISTPYSPVYLANTMLLVEHISGIVGESIFQLFATVNHKDDYRDSIQILGSNNYFNSLKQRWNGLTDRPQLHVITGISGLLMIYSGLFCQYFPFDGLVRLSEQRSISNASFYDLKSSNLPCANSNGYLVNPCNTLTNDGNTCTKKSNCNLTSLNIGATLLSMLADYNESNDTENPHINAIDACLAGLEDDQSSCPSGYENYYNIFNSIYSHGRIVISQETIAILLVLLK